MPDQQLDFHKLFAAAESSEKEDPCEAPRPFLEFFSGGGMARLGLGSHWTCVFANDSCKKKASAYKANFAPASELCVQDIQTVTTELIPGKPELAWASFPCQDLSLAGQRSGLKGQRSGTFWAFWDLIEALQQEGRKVPLIVLENVVGATTSNKGQDFIDLLRVLVQSNYKFGPLIIDGLHFVPQSRPRLFIVAVDKACTIPSHLLGSRNDTWHPKTLQRAFQRINNEPELEAAWLWWSLPDPPMRETKLIDVIEEEPLGVAWNPDNKTARLIEQMSAKNLEKLQWAKDQKKKVVGTIYKRTRQEKGQKIVRAEVRFDQISGCLRAPTGGSSRQTVIVVEEERVRTRLLSTREAARLMGVTDDYQLPEKYNEAYHLMGDALVVPAVSWLEQHILRPLSIANSHSSESPKAAK